MICELSVEFCRILLKQANYNSIKIKSNSFTFFLRTKGFSQKTKPLQLIAQSRKEEEVHIYNNHNINKLRSIKAR